MDKEINNRRVSRRRLLGRAGAVAATVAGAGAVGASIGSPAAADPNLPVLQGNLNHSWDQTTSMQIENASAAALTLINSKITQFEGRDEAGPALRLTPAGDVMRGPLGSLGVSLDGTLWTVTPSLQPDTIRTASNSTYVESFTPVRILDTRPGQPGKGGMINPGVLTPQGLLPAGQQLHLSLDELLYWGWTILANITVVAGPSAGYLTAFPYGSPPPLASNVNFSPGAVVSNFATISVGHPTGGPASNAISLFANAPVAIIVDIAGAVVNWDDDIRWEAVPGLRATAGRESVQRPPRRSEVRAN